MSERNPENHIAKEGVIYIKKDTKTVNRLEHAFAIGADIRSACAFAEITHTTYYKWIKEDEEIRERFERLRERPVLKAFGSIYRNLNNPEIAKWYLTKVRPEMFGDKLGINVNDSRVSEEELELKRRKLIELEAYVKADIETVDTKTEEISIEPS